VPDRDLCFIPATTLARLYRARRISPLEVTEAVLARIDAVNPKLNAYVTVARGSALEAARKATAALKRNAALPALHGVPVSIKDLTPTKGLRTTWGSKIFEHHVPDEDALMVERLKAAARELSLLEDQARRLDGAVAGRKAELAACENKLRGLWQGEVAEEFAQEDTARLVQLAGRTRATMQEFLRRETERKIDRLSALITESFRFLLRKGTLVERIFIDPRTFGITLYDHAGQALAKQRLSEGEKQIFAIAVLWGLARASARPLPAVIDTPMARLDAAHRQHLVERSIARAYHLAYDERSRATVAEEGYFWKE